MNKIIKKSFDNFQIADLDDDMVGMCKSLVDWIKLLRKKIDLENIPLVEPPVSFFKLNPHQPKMEIRKNLRKFLAYVVYKQPESNLQLKMQNLYVAVIAATYVYHMPTEKMVEASLSKVRFTRDNAKEMLLNDNMSSNWLKEPSGRDFTAIML